LPDTAAPDPPPPPAEPPITLEFALPPAELPKLLKSPAFLARHPGRPRGVAVRMIWHDSADGALEGKGLALCEQPGLYRIERLWPREATGWLPATQAPVLTEGPNLGALDVALPLPLVPVAAFAGRLRTWALDPATGLRLEVLDGALRGVAVDEPACRVLLHGPRDAVTALLTELASQAPIEVPTSGLAASAIAVARGKAPQPRQEGAPSVPDGLTVDQALALVTAHLADVILYWAKFAPEGASPDPVHQMRVAVRRLRSALSVFRHATSDTDLKELTNGLKNLATMLGCARDWDVFLAETGATVQAAFPSDRKIATLMNAGRRQRAAYYAALREYLTSDAWRILSLRLALLPLMRPWAKDPPPAQAEILARPAADYAAVALHRRAKRVLEAGKDFETLPHEALHEVRKQAKRLRYAAEFFEPLFPAKAVKRTLRRLEELQETLGAVNDGAVAAALLETLGPTLGHGYAAGVVRGFLAHASAPAAANAAKAWEKFIDQTPFWHKN
jgi:CHAD domain-containing protein